MRLIRTVRHLKPVQIYGRVLTRLPAKPAARQPTPGRRRVTGPWVAPIERPRSLIDRWHVRFLNETGEISQPSQWNAPERAKLWTYNLHYFDDLTRSADDTHRSLQRELVARWIDENAIGSGNGWEPYPTSLRLVSWIKWSLGGVALEPAWQSSLADQARWLRRHIEWHLLGNHLLANAKALIFAGLFFDGAEAGEWLSKGLSILAHELDEQILDDGAHFELSPMYHAIMLEDLLDLANAARAYGIQASPLDRIAALTTRMRTWLAAMCHADGEPAFFNDTAFGIAPRRGEIEDYAKRLGLPSAPGIGTLTHLESSGYVRATRGGATLILDAAAIGPDYLPGHAHADTLAFELSFGRERVIVNSGTSTYAPGALRKWQRSTAAHSTVEIDGADSSEVWASFRVARRARVHDVGVTESGSEIVVRAAHDGYRRLRGRPIHRRSWRLREGQLEITDTVDSSAQHSCIARFHLGPQVRAAISAGGRKGTLRLADGRTIAWSTSHEATIVPGTWYPEFGKAVPTTTLAVPFASTCCTTLDWTP
ncbi:MAG: alginate lyase family protein [Hyphomicrobiaceae bacterium]